MSKIKKHYLPLIMLILAVSTAASQAQELTLYGAGSVRKVMTDMTETFGKLNNIPVKTDFAFSGLMRERIEAGEQVDVFTSADMGHPEKLLADGRADTVAMFARNSLCLVTPERVGNVTPDNALDVMLRNNIKIGVYPPDTDPLGAYTVQLYQLADTMRPGSADILNSKSVVIEARSDNPAPVVSGHEEVDAIIDGRFDVVIAYCSGASRYRAANEKAPDIKTSITHFPAELMIGPEYGLAVLKGARPEAVDLAMFILSTQGQKILQKHDFMPIGLPQSAKAID